MKRDARVFVRCGDTPWISTYCPNCGKRINADDHFCKECGQELSFE
ncbi:MAG: zinc ribbon domain-containing protein, partial [Methanobrevibacter sp.]|nr:zinc ribbon domain-containing protein [Methanobrevibacter sp.]